eukprot:jgi/Ulvmu1/10519/UM064_0057.1
MSSRQPLIEVLPADHCRGQKRREKWSVPLMVPIAVRSRAHTRDPGRFVNMGLFHLATNSLHSFFRPTSPNNSNAVPRGTSAGAFNKPVVLVTGANGKTGRIIAKKIKESEEYSLRALTRSEEGKQTILNELALSEDEVVVADVAKADLSKAAEGCAALIVATSATPKPVWSSFPGFFWARFVKQEKVMPKFTYPAMPETVDWEGQRRQFDAAKAAGVSHVVVVSSMGGTQPENTLNSIGDGNILVWKRKAEQYLVASSQTYTILHPGGLKDSPGGQAGVVLDVDDRLLERKVRSISRADVAELCVQSLGLDSAKNRSVDCINDENVAVPVSKEDFDSLFSSLKGNNDYSINPAP